MQDKKYFYTCLAAFFIVLVAVFGWNYLVSGTTIGTDIETVNLLITGTTTLATTTIGTNFYIDETGAASTTGAVLFGSTFDVTGVSTLSGGFVSSGTSTLATTTIGTNFYIDESGNASTTGTVLFGSTFDVTGVSTLSGGIVNTGTTTLATTTIGTNFYVDETGAASTTGAVILGSTLTVTGETKLKSLINGGATTTLATGTDDGPNRFQMTAANFCDNSLVYFEEESASTTTLYLPSASALIGDCIPDEGDRKSIYLINNTDDVASTTLTASTSINLKMGAGNADAVLNSLFGGWAVENDNAWIECINKNDTEVDCRFETIVAGD